MIRVVFLLLLWGAGLLAQPSPELQAVFHQRREALMARLGPGALAVFPSRPVHLRNLDVEYPYRQESNLYYLTGFEEPDAIAVLRPFDARYRFVLFVARQSPRSRFYEGDYAGLEGARRFFGADTAFYFDQFKDQLGWVMQGERTLYYTFGINPEVDRIIAGQLVERRSRSNYPIVDPQPLVAELRLIKNEGDWKAGFQKAIDISVAAHIEAIRAIHPGMGENEVQAIFQYVYRKNGSPRDAYPPIIGSGPNSCILHYGKNNRVMQAGEVVLMDCAAEYGYYAADITRTVPVNGRFSEAQKTIYNLVLKAQEAAIQAVRPGLVKARLDTLIEDVLSNGLLELGFIRRKEDFSVYTLHKYAHWLGLDVHDVGGYTRNGRSIVLQPGMVFTVEPGIYVRPDVIDRLRARGYSEEALQEIARRIEPYLNIGVRIEDDVLVTDNGHRVLTAGVPRTVEAIEQLMAQPGLGEE